MIKSMQIQRFVQLLFERSDAAAKAGRIVRAILCARSARLTDIARAMPGGLAA